MLLGRAAIYFDEVVRRGALRRAADILHIAPSAVDRQIIQLEEELGTKLFERTATGMRMTPAGELLVDGVRRWRRDLQRIRSEIDNLVGLRRGKVAIAMIEGAVEFITEAIVEFRKVYPGIEFRVAVYGAQGVIDQVLAAEMDLGITFNPPNNPSIRIDRTMIYSLGLVVSPDHPLADRKTITLPECADYPMIIPDESLSLRRMLDKVWARQVGGPMNCVAEVSSIALMKSLARRSVGAGWLTAFGSFNEINSGELVFIPLRDDKVDLSTLSLVSASGRTLSVPASLFLQHMATMMASYDNVPVI